MIGSFGASLTAISLSCLLRFPPIVAFVARFCSPIEKAPRASPASFE